ncbi:MAG: hypothetical protein IJ461_02930 [Clostridia bacterium]|nr:hypothetical protein [Clostridia bacterium]
MLRRIKENPAPLIRGLVVAHMALGILQVFMETELLGSSINYAIRLIAHTPAILLLIHLLVCYGRNRTQLLPPIGLGVSGLLTLLQIVLLGYHYSAYAYGLLVILLFLLVDFYLAADGFLGYKLRKISRWVIMAAAAYQAVRFISYLGGLVLYGNLASALLAVTNIGSLCWWLALLIFWQYGALPPEAEDMRAMLGHLKADYEAGLITEEKYHRRKAALLKRL